MGVIFPNYPFNIRRNIVLFGLENTTYMIGPVKADFTSEFHLTTKCFLIAKIRVNIALFDVSIIRIKKKPREFIYLIHSYTGKTMF